jgi:NAD(P)-dependent dehydrogenase (short-subunit alcohol dehydrogenase family)
MAGSPWSPAGPGASAAPSPAAWPPTAPPWPSTTAARTRQPAARGHRRDLQRDHLRRAVLLRAVDGRGLHDLDAQYPFGRVCLPEDVAGVVAFLVSADSGYVTGQRLVVDGGGPDAGIV